MLPTLDVAPWGVAEKSIAPWVFENFKNNRAYTQPGTPTASSSCPWWCRWPGAGRNKPVKAGPCLLRIPCTLRRTRKAIGAGCLLFCCHHTMRHCCWSFASLVLFTMWVVLMCHIAHMLLESRLAEVDSHEAWPIDAVLTVASGKFYTEELFPIWLRNMRQRAKWPGQIFVGCDESASFLLPNSNPHGSCEPIRRMTAVRGKKKGPRELFRLAWL